MSVVANSDVSAEVFHILSGISFYAARPTRLERFPKLSSAFLAREGLLVEHETRARAYISHSGRFLVARRREDEVSIMYIIDDQPVVQEMIARHFVVGCFMKPLFICPLLDEYCKEVILYGGIWASRQGRGLRVRNGTAPQRKREAQLRFRNQMLDTHSRKWARRPAKAEQVSQVRRHILSGRLVPDIWRPLEALCEQAIEADRVKHRNRSRSRHPEQLSMEAAIAAGTHASGLIDLRHTWPAGRGPQ